MHVLHDKNGHHHLDGAEPEHPLVSYTVYEAKSTTSTPGAYTSLKTAATSPYTTAALTNDNYWFEVVAVYATTWPSTVVCTSLTSEQVKDAISHGWAWIAGLADLRNVTHVDLPTGHWPMWSRPQQLAAIIGEIAGRATADLE